MKLLDLPAEMISRIAHFMSNETRYYFNTACIFMNNLLDVQLTIFPVRLLDLDKKSIISVKFGENFYLIVWRLCIDLNTSNLVMGIHENYFENYDSKRYKSMSDLPKGYKIEITENKSYYEIIINPMETNIDIFYRYYPKMIVSYEAIDYKNEEFQEYFIELLDSQHKNNEKILMHTSKQYIHLRKIAADQTHFNNHINNKSLKNIKKYHTPNAHLFDNIDNLFILLDLHELHKTQNLYMKFLSQRAPLTIFTSAKLIPIVKKLVNFTLEANVNPIIDVSWLGLFDYLYILRITKDEFLKRIIKNHHLIEL